MDFTGPYNMYDLAVECGKSEVKVTVFCVTVLLQHFLNLDLVGGVHSATLLHTHETDTRATMCMSLGGDVMAAGQDANCSLMRFSQHAAKQAKKPAAKDGQ